MQSLVVIEDTGVKPTPSENKSCVNESQLDFAVKQWHLMPRCLTCIAVTMNVVMFILLLYAYKTHTISRKRYVFVISRSVSDLMRCFVLMLEWLIPGMNYSRGHNLNHWLVSVQVWTCLFIYVSYSTILLIVVRKPMFYRLTIQTWHMVLVNAAIWIVSCSIATVCFYFRAPNFLVNVLPECPFRSCQLPSMIVHFSAVFVTYSYVLIICTLVMVTIMRHNGARQNAAPNSTEENWNRMQKMLLQTCSFSFFYLPVIVCLFIMLLNSEQFFQIIQQVLNCHRLDSAKMIRGRQYVALSIIANTFFAVRIISDVLMSIYSEPILYYSLYNLICGRIMPLSENRSRAILNRRSTSLTMCAVRRAVIMTECNLPPYRVRHKSAV